MGYDNGMRLQVDAAGRIVLPKPVRTRYGIKPGVELELEEAGDAIVLRPRTSATALEFQDGMLVYAGELPKDFDIRRIIEEDSTAQAQRVWAGK